MFNTVSPLDREASRRFVLHYDAVSSADFKEVEVKTTLPFRTDKFVVTIPGSKKEERKEKATAVVREQRAMNNAIMVSQQNNAYLNKDRFINKLRNSTILFALVSVFDLLAAVMILGESFIASNLEFLMPTINFLSENLLAANIVMGALTMATLIKTIYNKFVLEDIVKNQFVLENSKTLNLVRENPRYRFSLSPSVKRRIDKTPVESDVFDINSARHYSLKELEKLAAYIESIRNLELECQRGGGTIVSYTQPRTGDYANKVLSKTPRQVKPKK